MMLKKKNKVGGLNITIFKTYYKATVIKTVWCWHKDRHISETKLIVHEQAYLHMVSFNKDTKVKQQRKSSLSIKDWESWTSLWKKWNLTFSLWHLQKLTQMDHRPEYKSYNSKTFRSKLGGNIFDFELGKHFLNTEKHK